MSRPARMPSPAIITRRQQLRRWLSAFAALSLASLAAVSLPASAAEDDQHEEQAKRTYWFTVEVVPSPGEGPTTVIASTESPIMIRRASGLIFGVVPRLAGREDLMVDLDLVDLETRGYDVVKVGELGTLSLREGVSDYYYAGPEDNFEFRVTSIHKTIPEELDRSPCGGGILSPRCCVTCGSSEYCGLFVFSSCGSCGGGGGQTYLGTLIPPGD